MAPAHRLAGMGVLACSIAVLLLATPCKGQLPQYIASLLEIVPASDQPSVMASLAQLNPQELPAPLTAGSIDKLKEVCQLLSTLPKPLPDFCASPPPSPALQSPPPPATPPPSLPPAAAPPLPGTPPASSPSTPASPPPSPPSVAPRPAPHMSVPTPAPASFIAPVPAPGPEAPTCPPTAFCEDLTKTDGAIADGPFGYPGGSALGMTITTPAGAPVQLTSFGFVVTIPPSYQITGVVSQWDQATTRLTGPILYTSEIFNGNGETGLITVDLATPLVLTPSTQYVLFFGADMSDGDTGTFQTFFDTGTSLYAGGAYASQAYSLSDFSGDWLYDPTRVLQFQYNAA